MCQKPYFGIGKLLRRMGPVGPLNENGRADRDATIRPAAVSLRSAAGFEASVLGKFD